jgi:hypothetical protein
MLMMKKISKTMTKTMSINFLNNRLVIHPTCLKMAQSTILGLTDSNFPTIDEIAIICGTDWFVVHHQIEM